MRTKIERRIWAILVLLLVAAVVSAALVLPGLPAGHRAEGGVPCAAQLAAAQREEAHAPCMAQLYWQAGAPARRA